MKPEGKDLCKVYNKHTETTSIVPGRYSSVFVFDFEHAFAHRYLSNISNVNKTILANFKISEFLKKYFTKISRKEVYLIVFKSALIYFQRMEASK